MIAKIRHAETSRYRSSRQRGSTVLRSRLRIKTIITTITTIILHIYYRLIIYNVLCD
jgi:hypothetical protein